jgi:hypothetical protein
MIARAALGVAALSLLGACGDDLESRQSAVQERQPMGGEITVGNTNTSSSRAASAPAPAAAPTAQGFADDDDLEDPPVVEAAPEALIDDAQGFSTDPIDDTSGFDPTPSDSGGFAPETLGAESFEE